MKTKVIIPQYVAEWYESEAGYNIWRMINDLRDGGSLEKLVLDWLVENYSGYKLRDGFDLLALIRINGYEVDKEPLYEVVIAGQYLVNQFRGIAEHILVEKEELQCWGKSSYQLEEKRIKAIDERFWAFAVRAEEEE